MHRSILLLVNLVLLLSSCSKEPEQSMSDPVATSESVSDSTLGMEISDKNPQGQVLGNWKTVKQQLSKDDLIDASFVDQMHGWVVSIKGDKLVPQGSAIFRTETGGRKWQELSFDVPYDSYIAKIYFVDRMRGWVVVQRLSYSSDKSRKGSAIEVLKTTDGGTRWKSGFLLPQAVISAMVFSKSGDGWILGRKSDSSYSSDFTNLALRTSDFGNTWTEVSPSTAVSETTNDSLTVSYEAFSDFCCFDKSGITIVSRSGRVLKTIDNGVTWIVVTDFENRKHSSGFTRIKSLGEAGFIAVSGANVPEGTWTAFSLFRTKLENPSITGGIFISDIHVEPNGEAVAVGLINRDLTDVQSISQGVVLWSNDLQNWQVIHKTDDKCELGCKLNEIVSVDKNKYFLIGSDGLFLTLTK